MLQVVAVERKVLNCYAVSEFWLKIRPKRGQNAWNYNTKYYVVLTVLFLCIQSQIQSFNKGKRGCVYESQSYATDTQVTCSHDHTLLL